MNQEHTIFRQLIWFLPDREFRRCVARYRSNASTRKLSCWEQSLAMVFALLAFCESLRDIDELPIAPSAFYVMDRGYVDLRRLYRFTLNGPFFVTRTKANILLARLYSRPVDTSTGLRSDHTVILITRGSASFYPGPLRRVLYRDPETGKRLKFLTNSFMLSAQTIAQIYKRRWEVELFFLWIKQHLRTKPSSAPAKTRSRRRFGSPFQPMCWSPSCTNG
jgi:IS4 transposase